MICIPEFGFNSYLEIFYPKLQNILPFHNIFWDAQNWVYGIGRKRNNFWPNWLQDLVRWARGGNLAPSFLLLPPNSLLFWNEMRVNTATTKADNLTEKDHLGTPQMLEERPGFLGGPPKIDAVAPLFLLTRPTRGSSVQGQGRSPLNCYWDIIRCVKWIHVFILLGRLTIPFFSHRTALTVIKTKQ